MQNEATVSRRTIHRSIGWSTLSTIIVGTVQILRLSILARFLTKDDFGLVAILAFVLGISQAFSDLGFSVPVMSEQNLRQSVFRGLFWLQFAVYNAIFLLSFLIAPFVAGIYHEPSLAELVPLAMLELPMISIGKLYDTVLQKELRFKVICIRNSISAILSLALAVVMAANDYGVYSLVWSTISYSALVNVWNFFAGQAYCRVHFSLSDFKGIGGLVKIGSYQMGTQILDYLSSKLDILIVSLFLDIASLGIYNLAKELVLKFVVIINTIVNKVLLPVLARCNEDVNALKHTFTHFLSQVTAVNVVIIGALLLFASFWVLIFYGQTYVDSADIVRVMACWSFFSILSQPNGLVAMAMKRTELLFRYTIARILLLSVLLLLFSRYSLLVIAWGMVLSYAVMAFVNWRMILYESIGLRLSEYLDAIRGHSLSLLLALIIALLFLEEIFPLNNIYYDTIVYGCIYVAGVAWIMLSSVKKARSGNEDK